MSPRRPIFFEIRDYYEVLGVGRNTPKEGISVAAHSLITGLRYKPGNDPTVARQIREVREAARVLTDPVERAAYDARLAESEKQFAWWDANDQVWRLWLADDVLAESVRQTAFGGRRSPRDQTKEEIPPSRSMIWTLYWGVIAVMLIVVLFMAWARYLSSEKLDPVPKSSWEVTQETWAAHWANVTAADAESNAPKWISEELAGGALHLDCPSEWTVDVDSVGQVGLHDANQVFTLEWSENHSGRDVGRIIDLSETVPDFGSRYIQSMTGEFQLALEDQGGRVLGVSEPHVKLLGPHETLYVQLALSPPATSQLTQASLLHFAFDCGDYVCQLQTYKAGSEPLTPEEWLALRRIISSIAFVQ